MERGELAPARVSRRLLDALSRLLGVRRDELEGAGDVGRWHTPPRPAPAIRFRAAPGAAEPVREDLEVLANALMPPAETEKDWDEVDELFRGGR